MCIVTCPQDLYIIRISYSLHDIITSFTSFFQSLCPLQVYLQAENGEGCIFKILLRYKAHSVGEQVTNPTIINNYYDVSVILADIIHSPCTTSYYMQG